MSTKVLLVDDDRHMLVPMEMGLRQKYSVVSAFSGEEGLARMSMDGPFAVVVSDRQMPGMDGIDFLAHVKERTPDTVRLMLTGNADLEHAVRVVNEGNIFRFLLKPCAIEVLTQAVDDAAAQHRLIIAEKELLNKTLNGSIKVLTDVLALVDAKSFHRTQQLRALLAELAPKLPLAASWEMNVAAMLALIGFVTLPPEMLAKARAGQPISKAEQQLFDTVPEITSRLLTNIPRLEGIAKIALYQHKHFDGSGFPADKTKGDAIPAGARLLIIMDDMLEHEDSEKTRIQALDEMSLHPGIYDMPLLQSVREIFGAMEDRPEALQATSATVKELRTGMILNSDVITKDGILILAAGHLINPAVLEKIQNFHSIYGIKEPISLRPVKRGAKP